MLDIIIFPFLCIIFSTILVYGPELYITTKKPIYIITTIITTNLLVYVIYKMILLKYSLMITAICGKILPTVFIAVISFFVVNDTKFTYTKLFALILVIVGVLMLE